MDFTAFDVDSAGGTCGAVIFAGSAADTNGFVDGNDGVSRVSGHHLDGPRRTMARTGVAVDTLSEEAVGRNCNGMSDGNGTLGLGVDGVDSSRGTDMAAAGAVGRTEALLEGKLGLHEGGEGGGGTQDAVGTLADTELTGGAMGGKMLLPCRAERSQRILALGLMLTLEGGETTVNGLLLCLQGHANTHGCHRG